jgi:tetratricopeptide (TPR) repeat protein
MKSLLLTGLIALTAVTSRAADAPKAAAGVRARFDALFERVKADPADQASRGELIETAAKLKPKPAIPKEATRHFVMAATFQKEAKTPADFSLAAKSYEDALAKAPWWPEAYYNQSVALESAGKFGEAKTALERYLLSKPKDAEAAERRLYALDAKSAMAERDAMAVVERKKDSLEGAWFRDWNGTRMPYPFFIVERRGEELEVRNGPTVCSSISGGRVSDRQVAFTCFPNGGTGSTAIALTKQGDNLVGGITNVQSGQVQEVTFYRVDR